MKKRVKSKVSKPRKGIKRMSKQEESIVSKVLNDRNLIVAPLDTPTGTIVKSSPSGNVRIEGEITPEKLERAAQFEKEFAQAQGEILDLAAHKPSEAVKDFVDESGITASDLEKVKKASPLTVFQFDKKYMIKTRDNKLEPVDSYCYRLEKAVLAQINIKKQEVDAVKNILSLKEKELAEANVVIQDYRKKLVRTQTKVRNLEDSNPFSYFFRKSMEGLSTLLLHVKPHCVNLKTTVLKLISK